MEVMMHKIPNANDIYDAIIKEATIDISEVKVATVDNDVIDNIDDFCSNLRKVAAEMPVTVGSPTTAPIKDNDIIKQDDKPTEPPVTQEKKEDLESVPAKEDKIPDKTDPPEKSAMEKLIELCDGAIDGHEHLKIAAGFGAAIKKVLPFLGTAAVGAGGTALAMDEADKKEDPKIYNLGLRRGYMAGADAMAEAITQSMGNGQAPGVATNAKGV